MKNTQTPTQNETELDEATLDGVNAGFSGSIPTQLGNFSGSIPTQLGNFTGSIPTQLGQ